MDEKEYKRVRSEVVTLSNKIVIFFWIILLAILLLVLTVQHVQSAPAPFPRTQPTNSSFYKSMVGNWHMEWASQSYEVTLSPTGVYTAGLNGVVIFLGHWTACNETKRIWITERPESGGVYRSFAGPTDGVLIEGENLSYGGVRIKWIRR